MHLKTLLLLLLSTSLLCAGERNQIRSLVTHADIYPVLPTGSMEPTLNENSFLLVKTIPFAEVKVGDIVVFEVDESLIVHRIIAFSCTRRYAATKGDANSSSDPFYVTEENYRGVVAGIIRRDLLDPEEKELTNPKFRVVW